MLEDPAMRLSPLPFFPALALAVLAFALGARPAQAQVTTTGGPSVTGINGTVTRVEADGTALLSEHAHPDGVLVNAINFADCEANLKLRIQLAVSGLDSSSSSYNLVAWAGSTDCTPLAARTPATATCWPVTSGPIPKANPAPVDIRVQDILSQNGVSGKTTTYSAGTETACHTQTTSGATAITLYFFFVDGNGNPTGTAQPYPVSADTVAGSVTGSITLSVGSTILYVNLPTSTIDQDVKGWNVYCDPPKGGENDATAPAPSIPSNNGVCVDSGSTTTAADSSLDDAALDEAGSVVDSGAPDTSTPIVDSGPNACGIPVNDAAGLPSTATTAGCNSSAVLVSGGGSSTTDEAGVTTTTGGVQKLIPGAYLCGQGDVTSSKITITGLRDGTKYNVAVAGRDAVGNVGPLSNVVCDSPTPVDDFWDAYKAAGGKAGGTFCALEGAGMPAGTAVFALSMVGVALTLARRRRRS